MTNTLHRRGTSEDLRNDYVIFAHTARGFNYDGSAPKIQEFIRICKKYNPVNLGDAKRGNILQHDVNIDQLIATQEDGAGAAAVFTNLDTVQKVMEDLIRADLGISINVRLLCDYVAEILNELPSRA